MSLPGTILLSGHALSCSAAENSGYRNFSAAPANDFASTVKLTSPLLVLRSRNNRGVKLICEQPLLFHSNLRRPVLTPLPNAGRKTGGDEIFHRPCSLCGRHSESATLLCTTISGGRKSFLYCFRCCRRHHHDCRHRRRGFHHHRRRCVLRNLRCSRHRRDWLLCHTRRR